MRFTEFALLGLAVGGVYALIGLSVVLVYRSSGVLNFAAGAISAGGAYLWYQFTTVMHWPLWPSLFAVVAAGAIVGALIHRVVMSRLRSASTLAKLIASLGVLTMLQGLILIKWGSNPLFAKSLLPQSSVHIAPGVNIGADRLWLIGIGLGLTALLGQLYARTSFGRATSAVAQNRRAASSLGWSASVIEFLNWSIGGALSALAGVLLAPIVGLSVSTLVLLVVPALAAALIGGFSSFALTALGAAAIGILESETSEYVGAHLTGASTSIPFLVIIVVIVAGGRARPARSDLPIRLPGLGPGRVPPLLTAIGIAIGLVLIYTLPNEGVSAVSATFIWAILVVSVVLVTGYAGQVSLGQWAVAGMGGWIAARLVASVGLPFWAAAIIGIIGAVPVGLVVALPAMRTRGVQLAVATLGLALVAEALILDNSSLTGGADGLHVGAPTLFGISFDPIRHPRSFALLSLACFVVVSLALANVRRGRVGRRLIAVRSNESAAASMGIGVYGAKLYAFGLASAVAAIAGILTTFETPIAVFSQFDILGSISAVIWAVIGGIGWLSGAVAGGQFATGSLFGWITNKIFGQGFNNWLQVLGGWAVISTLTFAPEGVGSFYHHLAERVRSRLHWKPSWRRGSAQAPVLPPRERRAFGEMNVTGLTVRYRGVVALDDVSFSLRSGEVLGLIGPNGAGKTTLLDAVSGFTAPAEGSVKVDGTDITSWSPVRRSRFGMSRTFQGVQLFDDLSVRDNLIVGAEPPGAGAYLKDIVWPGPTPTSDLLEAVVDEFGLQDHLDSRPADLPQGLRRLVGIARAAVTEPNILFLDEPAAGLDQRETSELSRLIRRLADEKGMTVVLVEHHVPMVLSTCDRVMVLDFGHVIAEGPPDEIKSNPAVIEAYLGAGPDDVMQEPAESSANVP